jgi:hypothetical protein
VKEAGEDVSEVTIYALHSNIVRQLLAGVPTRVVALNHDTSVAMIEKTYSRYMAIIPMRWRGAHCSTPRCRVMSTSFQL